MGLVDFLLLEEAVEDTFRGKEFLAVAEEMEELILESKVETVQERAAVVVHMSMIQQRL